MEAVTTSTNKDMEPTPQQWGEWANHKSNKDRWIEEQERQDEIQEEATSLEEKVEAMVEQEIEQIQLDNLK